MFYYHSTWLAVRITADNNGQKKACRTIHSVYLAVHTYIHFIQITKMSLEYTKLLPLDSVYGGLYVLETWTICMCVGVQVCACMCAASSPYLLHPGYSANIHSKEPLVVIQGVTQPQKMSLYGEGERQIKRNDGVGLKPNNQPLYLCGVPLSLLIYLLLPA